jgi:hypothetical protein
MVSINHGSSRSQYASNLCMTSYRIGVPIPESRWRDTHCLVIPAEAGIQALPWTPVFTGMTRRCRVPSVIPAEAGIQRIGSWTPAFAGVTA